MLRFLLLVLLAGLGGAPLRAQPSAARGGEAQLTASDAAPGDRFGISVAISGTHAIVGAYNDDSGRGAAYAFQFDGTAWVSRGTLRASDGVAGDQFGWAVALSGDRAIVTAPKDDGRGSAYGFVFNGATWAQRAKLVPQGTLEGDFGISAAVSGDRAVVGMASDGAPSVRGSAFVYLASGTSWTQQAQLMASGGAPGDNFGFSVAVSGDRLLVGAFGASSLRGSAYVFDLVSGVWVQRPSFRGAEVIPGDRFGRAVALSGDRALVGADEGGAGGNAGGAAYVFELTGTTWVQRQRLVASDRPTSFANRWDERFGAAVALTGDQAVIGAQFARVDPTQTSNAVERGAAYLFAYDATWRETEKVTASDWAPNDRFGAAVAITDGAALVGAWAKNFGQGAAYVYGDPAGFGITAPAEHEIVQFGDPYTIEFGAPGIAAVDLYLVARSQSPGGARVLIAENVPASGGVYEWDVPEDLLSPSTFLVAVDADDPSQEVTSARFRVRDPQRLYRVVGTAAAPEYERLRVQEHGWNFAQDTENVWPRGYWDQPYHAYNDLAFGYDPFVAQPDVPYFPVYFTANRAWQVPSWPSWVRAFGLDATYASLDPLVFDFGPVNQANLLAVGAWRASHNDTQDHGDILGAAENSYQGICAGISTGMLAAFQDPSRFDATWLPTTGGSEHLATVPLNREVRDAVHALQNYQWGAEEVARYDRDHVFNPITPRDVLARLRAMLERDNRDEDFFVWFSSYLDEVDEDGNPAFGAHAVVPLGLDRVGEGVFDIGVFDPNDGNVGVRFLTIDSTANAWTYGDGLFLGARGIGLYTSVEVNRAFAPAVAPWMPLSGLARPGAAVHRGEPVMMSVDVAAKASAVTTSGSDELRWEDGVLTETIAGGYALFPLTGQPSTPTRYRMPAGDYGAEVVADASGLVRLSADRGRLALGFERADTAPGARDVFALSPEGLALTAGSGGEVAMFALATVGAEVRRMHADSLAVPMGGQVSMNAVADTSAFRLAAPATATTYDLTLGRAASGGLRSFYHADVPLVAGATHTVRPDWTTLGDGPVTVEVDLDGDGTTDETMRLEPDPLPVARAPGPAAPPALAVRAYPNPARGTATVDIAMPEAGAVRVSVFDALGREVAGLHDGPLAAGTHALAFDTTRLPAGVYVVRVEAGGEAATRTMTVVR